MRRARAEDALLGLLYPPRCALCRKAGVRGICAACEREVPYTGGAPFRDRLCPACAAPLRYEGTAREAMLRYKFCGGLSAGEGFGLLVARAAAESFSGGFELVSYVPVSGRRLRRRGYDQAWEIARWTCRCWDTAPVPLLRKIRDNPPQSGLSGIAQRQRNVRGAYRAVDDPRLKGASVLLIDDILTTGATLAECAATLLDAGAASVVCAVVAAR